MLWALLPLPLLLCIDCLLKAAGAAALPPLHSVVADEEQPNANHIFNAIHSSMRQWGSSLNHNGMSLFLAQVPAGTQLYHGTGFPQPVQGMEWLAFEPEHATNFAKSFKAPDKESPNQGMSKSRVDRPVDSTGRSPYSPVSSMTSHDQHMLGPSLHYPDQNPVMAKGDRGPPRRRPFPVNPGWLHVYNTKTHLPLLYIDGMSAAKCDKGTLDTQDILLLNAKNVSDGVFWERERAKRLCQIATERWHGKIKGFIRMEAGFEVILCSFADSLDFVEAVRAGPFAAGDVDVDPHDESARWWSWDWVRAIAQRYDGIGGGRVVLNDNSFVTAYAYDLDLFSPGKGLPRLIDASDKVLEKIRADVEGMVHSWDPSLEPIQATSAINWQNIADTVVARYAKWLKYMASGAFTTSQELSEEIGSFLRVFIDSDARNTTAEVDRCASQFIPRDSDWQSVAARAIRSVTTTICSSLFDALDPSSSFSDAMTSLHSLIEYLGWTEWQRCPECSLEQVCFIPVFPFGSAEDHEHPQCRNATEVSGRFGYWENRPLAYPPAHGGEHLEELKE